MEPSNKTVPGAVAGPDLAELCQKIRVAAEPVRVAAVSLHDAAGEMLWLTESSMGPDEHNAVREAAVDFQQPQATPIVTQDLGNSRSAVLIRLAGAQQASLGIVMLIVDSRAIGPQGRGVSKVMTPAMQRALGEFTHIRIATLAKALAPTPPASKRPAAPVTPQVDKLNAALRASPIALNVQKLVPMARGGDLQRYEVLLRSKSDAAPNLAPEAMLKAAVEHGLGSMIDRRVLTELIGWLVRHPRCWQDGHTRFTMNLTATALHDDHFFKFVELCLIKAALPQGLIGFEISVPAASKLGGRMAHVAATLHRIGCPLVLDDFDLRTECFAMLRLPGVRLLKLSQAVTAQLRTDKIAQASITAVAQMSRVLGIHTVAKRTESTAEHEWLTALGVDFVQSNALSAPVGIDALAADEALSGGAPAVN
ncbi:MAG: EAL domain-containing protein [Proteobacteria bacterium]|nr:EAL domain-containing protein [Pseudomonadota bacterium]